MSTCDHATVHHYATEAEEALDQCLAAMGDGCELDALRTEIRQAMRAAGRLAERADRELFGQRKATKIPRLPWERDCAVRGAGLAHCSAPAGVRA